MNWNFVLTVARTTFREFWRSPEAVFWTYGFPVLMAVVLGFAYRPATPPPVPVALVDGPGAAALATTLATNPRLQVETLPAATADAALARGRVAILIGGAMPAPVLRSDPTRADAELARLLVEATLRDANDGRPSQAPSIEAETRPGARYIDFLIPGLLGLNLLGAGMWGVGFNLVQMRTQHLLRRLLVTPMRRSEFLAGYLLGRFVLVVPESAAIVLFGVLLWDVPFRGSVLAFVSLVIVGGFAFAGLGCLIASRARTIEGVAGLMNLVQLPMWLLGGSFFSNERFTGVLAAVAEILPLTHLNRALRDVMLEPGGIDVAMAPLALLGGFTLLCFTIALRIFRWS